MRKIRRGCFETNSSSVHAICIATDGIIEKARYLIFSFGEYGWEEAHLYSSQEKLSYALTALFNAYPYNYEDVVEKYNELREWFREDGIQMQLFFDDSTDDAVFGKTIWSCGDAYWHDCGSLDHADEAKEFVDYIFDSKENMFAYLFNENSYVETGNDNSDYIPRVDVAYPHVTFWKGN